MFKFLKRTICLIMLCAAALAYLVITRGGEPFRWFGDQAETKLERAGERLKEYSEGAAEKAERLKESTRQARESVRTVQDAGESLLPGEH